MVFGFKKIKPRIFKSSSNVTGDIFEIILEENNQFSLQKQGFAGQSRLESLTDVKFYDDTHLIVANRADCMLYLIEFDYPNKTFQVKHSIQLYVDKRQQHITLFTIHEHKIYFTTLTNRISVVEITNNKLVMKDTFTIPEPGSYHGIAFDLTKKDIIYLTSLKPSRKLTIYSLQSKSIIQSISLPKMDNCVLKQCTFLDKEHIAVIGSPSTIRKFDHDTTYHSYIGIYNIHKFECIDVLEIPVSQVDDIMIYNNKLLVSHQGAESYGKLLSFGYENMKLVKLDEKQVYGFPHGFDIRNKLMACTSMSNSSVSLFNFQ